MSRLVDAVRGRLVDTGAEPTPAGVAAALRAEERVLGDAEVLTLVEELRADLVGAGPLEPLLNDAEVTDVLVNGAEEVWVDTGRGLVRTAVRFPDETTLRRLAQRLAAMAGRRLDDAAPYVDARLPGDIRLHAVLPPIAGGGTCLSLRLPRRRAFTLDELVAAGAVPEVGAALLTALVAARAAFLVTGGTGTGKTTLLGSLLSLVRRGERLVLVEDSAELRPAHDHVVRLEARPPNLEGAGEVGLHDLVRQALRMRPDRLVVGEVRGSEVVSLLAALNTGHEGGCGTLHANAAGDVPARLEALACAAGLSREAVHSQLAAALDVVVHLVRESGGPRRIAEVCLLRRGTDGLVGAVPAVSFAADGQITTGPGAAGLADRLAGLWRPPGAPPSGAAPPTGPAGQPPGGAERPPGAAVRPPGAVGRAAGDAGLPAGVVGPPAGPEPRPPREVGPPMGAVRRPPGAAGRPPGDAGRPPKAQRASSQAGRGDLDLPHGAGR